MVNVKSTPDEIIREGTARWQNNVPFQLQAKGGFQIQEVQTYNELVDLYQKQTGGSEDEAQFWAGAVLYSLMDKLGVDPNEWKLTVDPVSADDVRYGPDEYNDARKFLGSWTKIGAAATAIAAIGTLFTAGGAVAIATRTAARALAALRAGKGAQQISNILNIGKLDGIKWLSVPASVATLGAGTAFFANTQLTATGDLQTYLRQGLSRGQDNLKEPGAGSSGSRVATTGQPRTIIRVVQNKEPEQFIGTLFSFKVGDQKEFERVLDDEITSEEDLLADVKINLTNWLQSFGGRLGASVVIRQNPVDHTGVKQSGIWATLTMHLTRLNGPIVPIDTILLGPVSPANRLKLTKQITEVQTQIPKLLTGEIVRQIEVPNGAINIFDETGDSVAGPAVSTAQQLATQAVTPTSTTNVEPTAEQLAARLNPEPVQIRIPTDGLFRLTGDFGGAIHGRKGGTLYAAETVEDVIPESERASIGNFGAQAGVAIQRVKQKYGVDWNKLPVINLGDLLATDEVGREVKQVSLSQLFNTVGRENAGSEERTLNA